MVGPSGIATGVVRGGLAAGWLAATGDGADTPGPRTHDAGADRRAGSTARMTSFLAVNVPVASQPAASPPRTTPVAMPLGPTIRDHWDADGGSPHSAHRALVGQNGALTSSPP